VGSICAAQNWTKEKIRNCIPSIFNIKNVTGNTEDPFLVQSIDTLNHKNTLNPFIRKNQFYLSYIVDNCLKDKIDLERMKILSIEELNDMYNNKLMADTNFVEYITRSLALYLISQGEDIGGWINKNKTLITKEEMYIICSQSFNRLEYKYDRMNWIINKPRSTLHYESKDNIDILTKAFCHQTAMYWVSKRKWNNTKYDSSFVNKVNEANKNLIFVNMKESEKIDLVNKMRSIMQSNLNFREAIDEEYSLCKEWLSFSVAD
jgi:hypothetical protein